MSDEEFLIVQAWVHEILTLPEKSIDTARQSRSTMNGTISQLHKEGSTNKTSDQRPVQGHPGKWKPLFLTQPASF